MTTTRDTIKRWLENPRADNATHMAVMCDTFDYEDYPVYFEAYSADQAREYVEQYVKQNSMTRIMEVYKLFDDHDAQLAMYRCYNY